MDQRISGGSAGSSGAVWVGPGPYWPCSGSWHHGKGQHDEGDVAVPSMPGAGLIMIKAKLVFCRLEAVLEWPSGSLLRAQAFRGTSPPEPRWRRKPGLDPQWCGGSKGRASKAPSGLPHSRWHRYRPVPHKPSHRGEAPWRHRPPIGVSSPKAPSLARRFPPCSTMGLALPQELTL